MVRAKFKVDEKAISAFNEKITLSPVMGNSPENEEFFKTTPSGRIEIWIKNPEASNQFHPGKEFYVDFTEVPS